VILTLREDPRKGVNLSHSTCLLFARENRADEYDNCARGNDERTSGTSESNLTRIETLGQDIRKGVLSEEDGRELYHH
jgi:hypothetical protein